MSEHLQNYRQFLRPDIVFRLARLDLRARLIVEGFLTGLHRSPYHGFSVEFAEYRQYMPGDEIRRVDWKVFGRTERYYVKEFEEETNLKAYLLLDASGSMGYTSGGVKKLEYASCLAASLTYLLLRQHDAVGLLIFDERIRQYLPPSSVSAQLNRVLRELDRVQAGRRTSISVTLHELAEKIKRRGLIILFSDLLDDPRAVLSGLKHFRHQKHEVIVFHVQDPAERAFPFEQPCVFRDLESGEEIITQPREIRSRFIAQASHRAEMYKRECREHNVDYVPIDTATPFDLALFAYLGKRQRMG